MVTLADTAYDDNANWVHVVIVDIACVPPARIVLTHCLSVCLIESRMQKMIMDGIDDGDQESLYVFVFLAEVHI